MLPNILSFVDVETTGTYPTRDRIIDIGIVRVENGKITKTLDTLIDPQDHLPPEITRMTGITTQLLEKAPTFRQQKEKIDELLEDSVVVAHNSNFDMAFLKSEYGRIGEKFNKKQICTVKLSRILFPRFKRHNLDAIVERFGLTCEPRHRAYPDARVLWDFFQVISGSGKKDKLEKAVKVLLKRPSIPKGISESLVDNLPETPGVYIFYDENQTPLYIGKSINIKARVKSHFYDSQTVSREFHISQQSRHIDAIEAEGELEALLIEKKMISEIKPIYNRQLREVQEMTIAVSKMTQNGYMNLELKDSTKMVHSDLSNILAVYKTKGKAKRALKELAKEHLLCQKLIGLEKGGEECFGCQIEICNGACTGQEMPVKYNLRFIEAFVKTKIKNWPFDGPIIIPEGKKGHLVYKWCYLGLADENNLENVSKKELVFDWDTYKILAKYILDPKKNNKIKVLYNIESA